MELNDFVKNFADIFEETNPSEITAETSFKELDEWDSLTALSVIAMAKTKYVKTINGGEIRSCKTVADLFKLLLSK